MSASPAVFDHLLHSLWGYKVVLMHFERAGVVLNGSVLGSGGGTWANSPSLP